MPDYLPHDMMNAEDDQILAELGERTMSDTGLDSPTAKMADLLDPSHDTTDDGWRLDSCRALSRDELRVLVLYAKLGRNAFLRHWEETSPPLD